MKISRRSFFKSAAALGTMPFLAHAQEEKAETLRFIHITDSHMDLSDDESI